MLVVYREVCHDISFSKGNFKEVFVDIDGAVSNSDISMSKFRAKKFLSALIIAPIEDINRAYRSCLNKIALCQIRLL